MAAFENGPLRRRERIGEEQYFFRREMHFLLIFNLFETLSFQGGSDAFEGVACGREHV